MHTDPLFLWKLASVETSQLVISTGRFPVAAGVAIDVRGNRVVQLFHHINTGRFLLFPWKVENVTLGVFYYT